MIHVEAGLERNAAAIEGNAFPDQHHRLLLLGCAVVLEDDEFGRLFAAAGDRKQGTHLQLFKLWPFENLALKAQLLRQCLRVFC